MVMRQVGWLDWEPIGFWPRWFYVWGLFAWAFALARVAPAAPPGWARCLIVGLMVLVSLGLDFTGRGLFWYQRPIARLREMIPGQLYLSAMPTYLGLKLAQDRYHFRTIINLYPEYTTEQSPHWQDELRFVREHGLNYVGNESRDGTAGDDFRSTDDRGIPARGVVADPGSLSRQHGSLARVGGDLPVCGPGLTPSADAPPRDRAASRPSSQGCGHRPVHSHPAAMIAPDRCAEDPTFALLKKCASYSHAGASSPPS